ncbi:MAG: hypothetical protein U9R42_04220 [Bacteroidota bacterium]|nr:hypothetical protein [Bacteroidota bacterium]
MKTYIILLFFIISLNVFCQTNPPYTLCPLKNAVTNPDNNGCVPAILRPPDYNMNPADPAQLANLKTHSESYDQYNNLKTCNWDWRTEYYYFNYTNNAGNSMEGPMYSPFYAFVHNNVHEFASTILKDYNPEDGWELIKRINFGNLSNFGTHSLNPCLILYNKYTGILRVFIYLTQNPSSNGGAISLRLNKDGNDKITGALSFHNSPANSLDNFDKSEIFLKVPNHIPEAAYPCWLHADFLIAYDPCTCGSQTQFEIIPAFSNTGNLEIAINGVISSDEEMDEIKLKIK